MLIEQFARLGCRDYTANTDDCYIYVAKEEESQQNSGEAIAEMKLLHNFVFENMIMKRLSV